MATRMQQRRGTAAQWTEANPILNAGEIGWESSTNKFKIGDGSAHWADLTYFLDIQDLGGDLDDYIPLTQRNAASGVATLDVNLNVITKTGIEFEGATADAFETTLTITDPTADVTLTLPNATDTLVGRLSTDTLTNKSISLGSNTITSTLAQLNTAVSDADVASLAGTETLTNKTLTSPAINSPTGITKSDVGLANVDNTTDANKPVSTATQTALDLKAPLASPTFTGTVTIPSGASISGFAPLASPTFTGTVSAAALTLSGDLTVNGTTTNINSTNLVVEDKNIILGDTGTPTDTTADGGGITLKGATDKTLNWVDSTDAWTSSEHINLASGKTLKYNGTDLIASQTGNSGKYLTTDGTTSSWGTVSGYSAPTIGSTSVSSGATVTTIEGLTLTAPTLTGTVTASGDINLSASGAFGSVKDFQTLMIMDAL